MIAPFHLLAEIQIIQCAGHADFGDIRHRAAFIAFHRYALQTANNLVALERYKAFHLHAFWPQSVLIDHKDSGIQNTVRQCRHRHHRIATRPGNRQNFSATGTGIQIVEDRAAVEEHHVIHHQSRNFAKRIDAADIIFRVHGVGLLDCHLVAHTKARQRNLDLASER